MVEIIDSPEFKEKLLEAIKSGNIEDWYYDGEDEVPYTYLDEDIAFANVINVIKDFLIKK